MHIIKFLLRLLKFIADVLRPKPYILSVIKFIKSVCRNRNLLIEMSKRDIRDRYAGQTLGVVWAVIQPIFLMAVYLFIFTAVFKIRLENVATGDGRAILLNDFAIYLLSGLIPWMTCQEIMTRSVQIILGEVNLVKQVVFPVEILPLKIIWPAAFTQIIATVLFLAYILVRYHTLPDTIILLPVLFGVQIIWMAGLSLLLSPISPFFRDLRELVSMICTVLMYATPIFYTIDMLPKSMRSIILCNPFAHLALCFQDIFYYGAIVNPWSWFLVILISIVSFGFGVRVFVTIKPILGNVL
ncbi:MAG: ABC transporter permease [Candidatus Omnitrophica bacterium]|nr:ABC transporter permease [Candidatus Omnitrophota bacterium]